MIKKKFKHLKKVMIKPDDIIAPPIVKRNFPFSICEIANRSKSSFVMIDPKGTEDEIQKNS